MAWEKKGNIRGPGSIVDLGQVTISQTATAALISGVRTVVVALAGLKKNDVVVLTPVTVFPSGFLVGNPTVRVNDLIDVPVFAPALIVGASYSFKARVFVLRLT